MAKAKPELHEHTGVCMHLSEVHSSRRKIRFTTKDAGLERGTRGKCVACDHHCGWVEVVGGLGARGAWRIKPEAAPTD